MRLVVQLSILSADNSTVVPKKNVHLFGQSWFLGTARGLAPCCYCGHDVSRYANKSYLVSINNILIIIIIIKYTWKMISYYYNTLYKIKYQYKLKISLLR